MSRARTYIIGILLATGPQAVEAQEDQTGGILLSADTAVVPSAYAAATASYAVGSPRGEAGVSSMGAATYRITIDCPDGGLAPDIGIAYNSQSGQGLAGHGFTITGLPVITRSGKDLFHDGVQRGPSYGTGDTFLLDGTRILLQSGTAGMEGSVYSPEGAPHTTVTLHGSAAADCWFEVHTPDGLTYEYGHTADSRLTYTSRKGVTRTAGWYVNRIEDAHADYATYSYITDALTVYPKKITYGLNQSKDRGISNTISFSYTLLSAAIPFALGDRQGSIGRKLSEITTATNGKTFRRYTFTYDTESDGSHRPFSRLTQVDEWNADGERLSPVTVNWNFLPKHSAMRAENSLSVPTSGNQSNVEELGSGYFAVDVNNDGVSDVFRLCSVEKVSQSGTDRTSDTWLYVNLSQKRTDGSVTCHAAGYCALGAQFTDGGNCATLGSVQPMDIDGDGYNDLVFLRYEHFGGRSLWLGTLLGKDIVAGRLTVAQTEHTLTAADETPLSAAFDINGDGREELLYVEGQPADGKYKGKICRYTDSGWQTSDLSLTFPKDPKKLFAADCNSDGLTDLIFFHEGGYKIYLNQGGTASSLRFSEAATVAGTNLGNCFRMEAGDFNGDGHTDFLYYQEGADYNMAQNNGDGTFTLHEKVFTLEDAINQTTNLDNQRFTILVNDMDGDGLSDILVSKANYEFHGGFQMRYKYKNTVAKWLYSTGAGFKLERSVTTHSAQDAEADKLFAGDFDGDGVAEVASYGSDLYYGNADGAGKLFVYDVSGLSSHSGKVCYVTDGYGNATGFTYLNAADPRVYGRTEDGAYPVNTYTLPLPLVSEMSTRGGNDFSRRLHYTYSDLRLHIAGRGLLGFNGMAVTEDVLQTRTETDINKWDTTRWLPVETRTTTSEGGDTAVTVSTQTVTACGAGNYFSYTSRQESTDLDGNRTETVSVYDTGKGVPVSTTTTYGSSTMYRQTEYAGYTKKGGRWLPTSVTRTQKHSDDPSPFVTKTTFSYNDNGDILTVTENAGTSLALYTERTYDTYGNRLTETVKGNGVAPATTSFAYDTSGQFVTRTASSVSTVKCSYTHDTWGSTLSESSTTEDGNTLTASYTYDGWGNLLSTTDPVGCKTEYSRGWGDSPSRRYWTKAQPDNAPWVKTWFDECHRETLEESTARGNVPVKNERRYDRWGNVRGIYQTCGDLSVAELFSYDRRNRLVADSLSSGSRTLYAYGNRSVTATAAGRSRTTVTDAWGNIVTATDPVSSVAYIYASCGKPVEVTAAGATATMEYDAAGNKTALDDPDAGRLTYTWAADGKPLTVTDARGVETAYTYDAAGHVVKRRTGSGETTCTYGTTGGEAGRLVKSAIGHCSVEYAYDNFGRMVKETRHVADEGELVFTYAYNDKNQLVQQTCPGGLKVSYRYGTDGRKQEVTANGLLLFRPKTFTGRSLSTQFGGYAVHSQVRDSRGFETERWLDHRYATRDSLSLMHDGATGNLVSRQRLGQEKEVFRYDMLDRLVSTDSGDEDGMEVVYAENGNILSKSGLGKYSYSDTSRPHAVTWAGNPARMLPTATLETAFNDLGLVDSITDGNANYKMKVCYGPDGQRWVSRVTRLGKEVRTTVYAGNYERVTEDGTSREFYYLDNNTVVIKEDGKYTAHVLFTDNLGSILAVYGYEGEKEFEASYDAWGRQTVTRNDIGLHRGYCGHEMLSEFGLVNMNGRLYDPVLGRFLSPDNHVQLPGDSQSFNRYSYCLNNPLKYVDRDGEWFGVDDLLIAGAGFLAGYVSGGLTSGHWGWSSVKGGLVGAATAWLGYNTAGVATAGQGICGATWTQAAGICVSAFVNKAFPTVSIPLGSHFGLSFSPMFGYGEGGLVAGMSAGAYYTDGDFSLGIGGGITGQYVGWSASAVYNGWGAGFGKTYYGEQTVKGNYLGAQTVGTLTLMARGDVSFRLSNDMFGAPHHDRWRTSAAELAIGNFTVGTYVTTNDGDEESSIFGSSISEKIDGSLRDPILNTNPIDKKTGRGGAWKNGKFYSAPLWIGLKSNSHIFRFGYSSRTVQSLTQNLVHKYIVKTPFFTDASYFQKGWFSYNGSNSPFSLW